MMNSSEHVYTLQGKKGGSPCVQVETVINRGLYKFTLLGLPAKQSSDTKHRVYAALKYCDLLNLKSDNRKIIVTLYPEQVGKAGNFYDLSVALSCIFAIQSRNKKLHTEKILAIGELSITGKIMETSMVYQALYTAYVEDITVIICGEGDYNHINEEVVYRLKQEGFSVIGLKSLKDSVVFVTNHKENTILPKHIEKECEKILIFMKNIHLADMDPVTRAVYISFCGGHSLLIETSSVEAYEKDYTALCMYIPEKTFGEKLYDAYMNKSYDYEETQNITYIPNLKNISSFNHISKEDSSVMIFTSCPCGSYNQTFFDTIFTPRKTEKVCFCSKRSIIEHKKSIKNTYMSMCDMKEVYVDTYKTEKQSTHESDTHKKDHIKSIHNNIDYLRNKLRKEWVIDNNISSKDSLFLGNRPFLNKNIPLDKLEDLLDSESLSVWKQSHAPKNILRVAKTIQDILNLEQSQEKTLISRESLLLALSYIPKMDF